MSIRNITAEKSVEQVGSELIYTEARLLWDPQTVDLAVPITKLLEETDALIKKQFDADRNVVRANARVDQADERLDDLVRALGLQLLSSVGGDRGAPRFRRYFKISPSKIISLSLRGELERVRAWPTSLKEEAEPGIRDLAAQFATAIVAGETALLERQKAEAARNDFRVRKVAPFIDAVNQARMSLYGELIRRMQAKKLSRDWPLHFFRRSNKVARTANGETTAPHATPA